MQEQGKEMHKVDAELYFVIDEKSNTIELTEKGIELMTSSAEDKDFFILPNVGEDIAIIEKSTLSESQKIKDKEICEDKLIKQMFFGIRLPATLRRIFNKIYL